MNLKDKLLINNFEEESTARLPKEYQEVEYITSNGTSTYIDTGIYAKPTLKFELVAKYNTLAGHIFSIRQGDNNAILQISYYQGNIYNQFSSTDTITNCANIVADTNWHTYKGENNSQRIDSATGTQSMSGTSTHTIPLFVQKVIGDVVTLQNYSNASVKYLKVYDNGVLVRHFIPCYRKSDSEAGLYDLVNGVFYTNQGTGSFTCGDPVYYLPKEYQEVEYIESSGTQWIQTSIQPLHTFNYISDIGYSTGQTGIYPKIYSGGNYERDLYSLGILVSTNKVGTYTPPDAQVDTKIPYTLTQGQRYQFEQNWYGGSLAIKQNGTTLASISISSGNVDSSGTLRIFKEESVASMIVCKFYSLKIYNSNILAYCLKPCYRKADNEIGLYDCVNNVFYTNQGTGSFSKGENVYYGLPSEYQKVEWIESSGTQYINTGYKMSSQKERIVGTFMLYPSTQYVSYFGSNGSNGYSILVWNTGNGSSKWASLYIGSDNYTILPNLLNTTKYTFDITADNGNYTYSINNSITGNGTYTGSIDTANNIFIFGKNNGSSIERGNGNRVYSFMLYDNDVLVRDFVPCYRKNGGEIGLYDIVNGTFYANSGTGSFTKGADDYDIIG